MRKSTKQAALFYFFVSSELAASAVVALMAWVVAFDAIFIMIVAIPVFVWGFKLGSKWTAYQGSKKRKRGNKKCYILSRNGRHKLHVKRGCEHIEERDDDDLYVFDMCLDCAP